MLLMCVQQHCTKPTAARCSRGFSTVHILCTAHILHSCTKIGRCIHSVFILLLFCLQRMELIGCCDLISYLMSRKFKCSTISVVSHSVPTSSDTTLLWHVIFLTFFIFQRDLEANLDLHHFVRQKCALLFKTEALL